HPVDALIFQEREPLRAGVVAARSPLVDRFRHLGATRGTGGGKSLGRAVQGALGLRRGHPCIERHALGSAARRRRRWFEQDGAGVQLLAGQFPRLPPPPRATIPDALLPRVTLDFQPARLSYRAPTVSCCPVVLATFEIPQRHRVRRRTSPSGSHCLRVDERKFRPATLHPPPRTLPLEESQDLGGGQAVKHI